MIWLYQRDVYVRAHFGDIKEFFGYQKSDRDKIRYFIARTFRFNYKVRICFGGIYKTYNYIH